MRSATWRGLTALACLPAPIAAGRTRRTSGQPGHLQPKDRSDLPAADSGQQLGETAAGRPEPSGHAEVGVDGEDPSWRAVDSLWMRTCTTLDWHIFATANQPRCDAVIFDADFTTHRLDP